MTVFITHAPQDRAVAEALERFLERRGQFVELEDGERGFRPLQFTDTVVALVSKDSAFSPWRLAFDKRTLDAWAEQKLVLVKLDHHFAPIGLRDLPFIDASFEAQRDFAWGKVAHAIAAQPKSPKPPQRERTDAGAGPVGQPAPARPPAAPSQPARKAATAAPLAWMIGALAALFTLGGLGAAGVALSIWLANRIGPTPGTFDDLWTGLNDFAARLGAPAGSGAPIAFALMTLAAITMVLVLVSLIPKARRAANASKSAPAAPGPGAGESRAHEQPAEALEAEESGAAALFISYARANAPVVTPVVDAIRREGRRVWLDTKELGAGDGWAGEIVRAIRTAEGVCVMCSTAAFESDHVKREVYLADRYKKRLLPVYIEEAAPPEDFEYFFAGVQHLRLYETPEAERGPALHRALGATP
jgi:hypothetical protein